MSRSPAKRLADKVQSWSPTLASVQEHLPYTAEEVKQKLRSWHKSLSKRGPRVTRRSSVHSGLASARVKASENLKVARKGVAEERRLTSELRDIKKSNPSPVARPSKIRPRGSCNIPSNSASTISLAAKFSEFTTNPTVKVKRTASSARDSFTASGRSGPIENIGKCVGSPGILETRTAHDAERTNRLNFPEAVSHPNPTASQVLHRSASASNLADHFRISVKRLRRSASNLNLHKIARSKSDDDSTLRAPINSPRHSAHSREPLLEPIAEDSVYQQRRHDDFRRDLIFALHDSRVCSPQAPPMFVESLPFNNASTYASHTRHRDSVIDMDGLERFISEPKRVSAQQHQRPHSTTVSLMEKVNRANEMSDLRSSINHTREVHRVPALEFHQTLCGQAEIVATMYDIQYGDDGSCWSTEVQLQDGPTVLELVGPPAVGGRVTGKMWADGAYSRHTQSSHAKFSHQDHEDCQCHNYKVWQAITDVRWRAIGLSRTSNEERWVAVLSE